MEFVVLGPLEVRRDGRAQVVTGRLRGTLLGVLLSRANRSVSVDFLVDALWGEHSDPRAVQKLHLHVHRLRSVLGEPDRLRWEQSGYRLVVRPAELDAERFESLVDEATVLATTDPRRAAALLRSALDLWRGDPFSSLATPELDDWARRLAERRLVAREALYQAELADGAGESVIPELDELARAHPLREGPQALLMTALYQAGRREEALAAYRRARRQVAEELGLEPGPELRELERLILAGGPLRAPGPRPVPGRSAAPAQLPAGVVGFAGREAELAELHALVSGSAPLLISALAGTAGVGKTALAVHWAHRVRDRFPDGQLYVDLRGYGPDQPLAPADALAGFLRALGLAGPAIPTDLAERAARFRTLVDRRRMLVVLDNANSVAQVRPLLPGSPTCATVITSRDTLSGLVVREGAHRISLDRLPAADARALLGRLLGERGAAEPAAVAALVERCARLPLALRIAADLVSSRPGQSIEALATELAGRQEALHVLDLDDPYTAMRAVFSWSYRRLGSPAARLFRLLGLHPGPDLDCHAAAALAGLDLAAARAALAELTRSHLVERPHGGRYQLHDLLRAYAAELAGGAGRHLGRAPGSGVEFGVEFGVGFGDEFGDGVAAGGEVGAGTTGGSEVAGEDERTAALGRLRDYYLATAAAAMDVVVPHEAFRRPTPPVWTGAAPRFTSNDQARRWLDAERTNLLDLTRDGAPRFTVDIAETLWRHLYIAGYPDEAIQLYSRELAAARALGDPLAEAHARNHLGKTLDQMGRDGEEALAHLGAALAAYQRAGSPDWQSAAHNNLGIAYGRRGEFAAAVREFEQALRLADPSVPWPLRRAPLVNLARCLRELGRYEEAVGQLRIVLARCEEDGDQTSVSNALAGLADLCLLMDRDAEAGDHARRGLAAARENGFRAVELDCLRVLGVVARRAGRHARALGCHEDALALARAIGARHTLVESLNELAATQAAAGRPAAAVRRCREALAVATEADDRRALARTHAALAELLVGNGDFEDAGGHWRSALEHYEALGDPAAAEIRGRLDDLDRGVPAGR
ncbi:BTAD domain-containing putative transcriptional regulator [Streptomyces sp. DSM 44915]|uniref:BTAD domain-containing putative transcriptional regulator n=1 Tax=Streptomyces chisholmiae TaxID=3075540 RepID=A0ABU2JR07_9ACTN|nr:BTAD domain-containing putative transcriptional regulator [Streptomyces sp. DSM 44915]MDT0266959.1 BTAD domain-containing putative transcriptional regulator [Streptomyces sp. DSM 44915]